MSDAVDENGQSIRTMRWIQSYANNDDWFDDTSDGYVRAEVRLKDTGEPVEVRGGAWVIVASPRYSPDTQNIVTLFDVMEEVLYDNQDLLSSKEFPAPRGPHNVDYEQDIKPILKRAFDYAWVNESALRGHGYNKPGDHRAPLDGSLGIPDNVLGQSLRERIFERIRIPTYSRPTVDGNDRERNVDDSVKREQASRSFMPQLSGDEGDTSTGDPATWLTVTHLQYDRLEAWSKGNFAPPPDKAESEAIESNDQSDEDRLQTLPFLLTKTALEDCAGGAFYPGIEMTSIARHPALYREAYRFNDEILEPGDVTKHMALPWQADFFECVSDWWPAQRPDDVLTNEDFDEIFESFVEETEGLCWTFYILDIPIRPATWIWSRCGVNLGLSWNGDPLLHHGDLYTALLRQLGIVLPDITSRAYADHSGLSESFMVGAVLPLAVSQHTDEFFPEILGMTLFLEWEILSVVPGTKLYDYLGIDSHFYRMHVGIDNATHGHGYAAKRAVELYLDNVSNSSGPEAVQAHWRRIWRGFVAFALGGSGIFSNDAGQDDDTIAQSYPGSPADRVVALMRRKKRYGNLQHGAKKSGGSLSTIFSTTPASSSRSWATRHGSLTARLTKAAS